MASTAPCATSVLIKGGRFAGIVVKALKASIDPDGVVREYFDERQLVLCCPNHGIEYDVRTGTCLANPRWRLRVYDTKVEDGKVVVMV